MKITLTTEELRNLMDSDRVTYLEGELADMRNLNKDFSRENRELREKLAVNPSPLTSHSSQIAQVMIAVTRYYTQPNQTTADKLRQTLEALLPGQKILQLKILRELSGSGLKEVKDFLEDQSNSLPSPAQDLDIPF
jgi:ribosomal protein L7/L12